MEITFCTHCIGGWIGPRAGLDAVTRKKVPALAGNPSVANGKVKPLLFINDSFSFS
jgi:hypothetical protein